MTLLVDRAIIDVRAGNGGDGCVSFRRERYVPKGGPDGGDGGAGGSVILIGDPQLDTLANFTAKPHYRARSGMPGMGKSMTGADGADCIVPVPLGTLIYDDNTNELLADISGRDQREIIAQGGAGGLGNEHFKSPTNQAPREFTRGEPGEEKRIRLELKLIADIGLIGMPNAGKSTLLAAISRATPKVAEYPFTTLIPQLGIAELSDDRRLIFADVPGLVHGAAGGAGLGHEFLRHVERTNMLVHLIDIMPLDGSDPVANYETIRREIFDYSVPLAEKPELIVFNKIDLVPDESEVKEILKRFRNRVGIDAEEPILLISAVQKRGTRELLEKCWRMIGKSADRGWTAPAARMAPGRRNAR